MAVHCDYETASACELKKHGLYRYASDPSTFVLCLQWAIDDEEPSVWVPVQGEPFPDRLAQAARDGVPFYGWNVAFERLITREIVTPRHGAPEIPLEQWYDVQAMAQAMGLPGSLDAAAKALDLPVQKDSVGKVLCTRMSKPRKPTADDPAIWWHESKTGPGKLQRLVEYCRTDVIVERAISKKVRALPDTERELYLLTERINDRGLPIDLRLVNACGRLVRREQQRAAERLAEITQGGITAATQTAKIAVFLDAPLVKKKQKNKKTGEYETVWKRSIAKDVLESSHFTDPVKREVAAIRLDAGGAAVRKLSRMKAVTEADGRARGQLRYHGAGPGRWAAQGGIGAQNIKAIRDEEIKKAIPGWIDAIEAGAPLDTSPLEAVPYLLRPCVVAPEGKALGVLDYSQIEARLVAWFADQHSLTKLFRDDGLIYETMAAALYGVPVEEVTKDQRFWGKTLILGAGYQLGADKLLKNTKKAGKEQPLSWCKNAIVSYRETYPRIRNLWYALQDAAILAVENPETWVPVSQGRVNFYRTAEWLYMRVPSGRFISFRQPRVDIGKFDKPAVYYWGREQNSRQWVEVQGYGGRWCVAQGTPVLTDRGWVPVESVNPADFLWDGAEWVRSSGAVFSGYKEVGEYHGASMTPDHEVLTSEGWKHASQSEGLDRVPSWVAYGGAVLWVRRAKVALACALRLWGREGYAARRVGKACTAERQPRADKLWVPGWSDVGGTANDAWDVVAPRIRCLVEHARSVSSAVTPGVEKLWRAWNSGLRSVGRILRSVLAGHGFDLSSRVNVGPDQQQRELRARQLSVGDMERADEQQTTTPVYDILNAGPRQRFVIRDRRGRGLIVHNCQNLCEAAGRDLMAGALLRFEAAGYPVLLTVHDEAVVECDPDTDYAVLESIMLASNDWAKGLPVACSGGITQRYGKV